MNEKDTVKKALIPLSLISVMALASVAAAITAAAPSYKKGQEPVDTGTFYQTALAIHAVNHQAVDPAALVKAVTESDHDILMMNLALTESKGDERAIGSVGEKGGFQVIESDWGKVPVRLKDQRLQAEYGILRPLWEETGDIRQALAQYNGGPTPPQKSFTYANKILMKSGTIETLMMKTVDKRQYNVYIENIT